MSTLAYRRWVAWTDRFLPERLLHDSDPLTRDRARLFLTCVSLAGCIALVSAAFHSFADTRERALFNAACAPFAVFVILILHATNRPRASVPTAAPQASAGDEEVEAESDARGMRSGTRALATPSLRPALDIFLGMVLAALAFGPTLSSDGFGVAVSIAAIPFVAATLGGLRAGLTWTLLILAVLGAMTAMLWSDPSRAYAGWNALIVSGIVGFGGCIVEGAREEARRDAEDSKREANDIAQQRDSREAELRKSRELLAHAFRRAPAMLILSDLTTRQIIDVNECFERLSGWTLAEARGKTLTELDAWLSPDDPQRLAATMLDRRRTQDVEIKMRAKDGRELWLLAAGDIVEMNGVLHILAQAIDITDRKLAEQALAESRRRLEARVVEGSARLHASELELAHQRQLASIGTLAAGIAHQINNPIASIMASAEYALLAAPDAGERGNELRDKALRTAISESARCGQIVKNVLRFARQQPTARWVEDVIPLALRAATLSRAYIADQGGELEIASAPEPLRVRMSPIEIEQVVVNLLRNAAEALGTGGRVRLSIARRGDLAEITVEDDGKGMDAEQVTHLFEPFYTTRVHQGGTGLGLAFAHGVIRDHGGSLAVESEPGKGTRLRIELPLVTA